MSYPTIIQGGMGVGVSGWQLARAVSERGQLGVVSGTALDLVVTRRLQQGDRGGHMRRALRAFPDQVIAQGIIDRYFIEGGKSADRPYAAKPMVGDKPDRELEALIVAANFVEVFLAKEGHDGMVGINYLHKIQAPLLASLCGAMLAGVDVVLVGAGIPLDLPGIMDGLCKGECVEQTLHVQDSPRGLTHRMSFDPRQILGDHCTPLKRPKFFPIVSSNTLASLMAKKCAGKIDGLILEGPTAGGHNAPPRGKTQFNDQGEPLYGARDEIKLEAINRLGLPYWLAGSSGTPEQLAQALGAGAAGVQVGTLFAFCEESGLRDDLKQYALLQSRNASAKIYKDPVASPTGFPFQVMSIPNTLSENDAYSERCRQCDLGYLREAYEKPNGTIGWRCPAETPEAYVSKGGKPEDAVGRKCLCNSLMANIALPQLRSDKHQELPLVTCGSDLPDVELLLAPGQSTYSAADAIDYLLNEPTPAAVEDCPLPASAS